MISNKAGLNHTDQFNLILKSIGLMITSLCFITFFLTSSIAFAGGVTIITHGWGGNMTWVNDCGDKLIERNGGSSIVSEYLIRISESGLSIINQNGVAIGSAANTNGFAVVKLNWSDFAGESLSDTIATRDTGYLAVATLSALMAGHPDFTEKIFASPIHLIGHSRGGTFVGAMAENLGQHGYWVDQITFIDPHPVENTVFPDDWGRGGMTTPGNVIFADNYYREGFFPNGKEVTAAYQIKLKNSYFDDIGGYPSEHSDVHAWYRGTIPSTPPPYSIDDFQVTAEWYAPGAYDDNDARPRDNIGYAYSLTVNGGNNRPYEGVHSGINGSGQIRSFTPSNLATAVNNVGYLNLRSTKVNVGETLEADYRYESWRSDFRVEFYLDTNRNPHDGYGSLLREIPLGISDGMRGASAPATLTVPNNVEEGTYYVFIKSTGSNAERYFYAPIQLEVGDGSMPPPPDSVTEPFDATEYAKIYSQIPDYNGGISSFIDIWWNPGGTTASGLLKFNLSDIPIGSVVESAQLDLNFTQDDGDLQIAIFNCTTPWTKSTVSWNNLPSFENTIFTSSNGVGTWIWEGSTFDNLIQGWIDNSTLNNGLYIGANNSGGMATFSTSASTVPSSNRPKLIVTYTPPPPPDLIITNLSPDPSPVNSTYYVGQSVDWEVTVKNNSDGPADSSRVGYYLGTTSTDFSKPINDDPTSALAAEASETDHDAYPFVEADIGTRYLICKADYENDVEESSDENNTRVYGPFNVISNKVATPTISPNAGTFTEPVQVSLFCPTPDSIIRYTTDGATPTASSTQYTGPFTIISSKTITVRGFKSGFDDSDMTSTDITIEYSLSNAISMLQILTGQTPDYDQLPNFDINGDERIGMAETLFVLRQVSLTDDIVAILSDDLEGYELDTWPSSWVPDANATSNPANNMIVQDPEDPSNQVLKMYGSVGGCWGAIGYRECSITDELYIEAKVYNGSESLSGCHPSHAYIGVQQGTSWTNYGRGLILFNGDGNITAGDGSVLQGYQTERWYNVKIHYKGVDDNLTLRYWIDGVYRGQVEITINDILDEISLDHVSLSAYEGSAYFDDVKVYTVED